MRLTIWLATCSLRLQPLAGHDAVIPGVSGVEPADAWNHITSFVPPVDGARQ